MNHQYKVKNPKLYHSSSSIHWVVLNPATTHFFRENLLAKSFHVLKIEKEEEGIEKSPAPGGNETKIPVMFRDALYRVLQPQSFDKKIRQESKIQIKFLSGRHRRNFLRRCWQSRTGRKRETKPETCSQKNENQQ